MANIIPFSFRGALFSGQHDFQASGGNTFKFSLYTTNPYTTASTVALLGTGNGEVDTTGGTNYSVKTLTNLELHLVQLLLQLTLIMLVILQHLSLQLLQRFTIQIQLMVQQDRLVVVLDFGGDKTATNGTFTVTFPDPATPANAIISMS